MQLNNESVEARKKSLTGATRRFGHLAERRTLVYAPSAGSKLTRPEHRTENISMAHGRRFGPSGPSISRM